MISVFSFKCHKRLGSRGTFEWSVGKQEARLKFYLEQPDLTKALKEGHWGGGD